MTYREQLTPWVVYRLWPDLRAIAVAQFRQRNEAEEYVKTVRRIMPVTARFVIIFVPPLPTATT
ncbi:MAG: hypothetical protein F6K04_10030 [Leptolyngbya sp. SIO4C5]|nr:hypothetical protein [Leptolyngbya sp. SIO4C5]